MIVNLTQNQIIAVTAANVSSSLITTGAVPPSLKIRALAQELARFATSLAKRIIAALGITTLALETATIASRSASMNFNVRAMLLSVRGQKSQAAVLCARNSQTTTGVA